MSNVPTNPLWCGKNTVLKTKLAAVAYRKKSYHSTVVPSRLASATVRSRRRRSSSVSSIDGSVLAAFVDPTSRSDEVVGVAVTVVRRYAPLRRCAQTKNHDDPNWARSRRAVTARRTPRGRSRRGRAAPATVLAASR
ncbi:Uncharacterised protein [Mycobacteroides abscessus subsp. abscessus]|nr:Uncharacterised protein [Mycobacteroides abscessus subsp. abscessus]